MSNNTALASVVTITLNSHPLHHIEFTSAASLLHSCTSFTTNIINAPLSDQTPLHQSHTSHSHHQFQNEHRRPPISDKVIIFTNLTPAIHIINLTTEITVHQSPTRHCLHQSPNRNHLHQSHTRKQLSACDVWESNLEDGEGRGGEGGGLERGRGQGGVGAGGGRRTGWGLGGGREARAPGR
jgi:hypothetical protein